MTIVIQTNLGKIELKAGFPISKVLQKKIRSAIEESQAQKSEYENVNVLLEKLKKKDPSIGTPRGALLGYLNARGWTQQTLSMKTGISQPDVSKMISGKRDIGLESAKKLAKAFGVDHKKFV